MDLDLSGKLALVTGSTRGIGLATAKGLAEMGAEVIVNGRERAAVLEAIARIAKEVPKAKLHPAPFDLGNAAGCAAIVAQFPEVDILVNNLGIYEPKPFFEIEDADWSKMFEVNVMSGVRLTRHYLKRMLDKKDWGRVVFNPNGTGSYTDTFGTGPGTIAVSRATDRSFAGRWGESEKRFGTLRFTLSPDGRTATGTWTPDPTCTIGDQGEHPLRWTRR